MTGGVSCTQTRRRCERIHRDINFAEVITLRRFRTTECSWVAPVSIGRPRATKEDITTLFYKHYPAFVAGR